MASTRAPFDPDLAIANLATLRAMIAAFGPVSRIANPRSRKMIRMARTSDKHGQATAHLFRVVLQDIRDVAAREARRG